MKSDQASEARSFVEFNTLLSGLLFEVAKFSGLGVKVYLFVGVLQLRGKKEKRPLPQRYVVGNAWHPGAIPDRWSLTFLTTSTE